MASNILNVLENVEKGRQNCIKNAKLANLPATDNMDIFNIGNLFLDQNNTEFIDPNTTWVRPSNWWDTKSILENAQDIEQDGVTYHPTYIILLSNTTATTQINKTDTTYIATQGDAYVFSDEPDTLYVGDQTHTWDVSKDKPCSDGYGTRYVIVYMVDIVLKSTIAISEDINILEIILGEINISNMSIGFITTGNNKFMVNFELTSKTISTILQIKNTSCFSTMPSLKRLSLPNTTKLMCDAGGTICHNCQSLIEINIPNVIEIRGGVFSYIVDGCPNLKTINMPNLETLITNNTYLYGFICNCKGLKTINLPKLKSISTQNTANIFCTNYSLENLILPNLAEININGSNKADTKFGNSNYSLHNIDLSSLKTINYVDFLKDCNNLKIVNLPMVNTIQCTTVLCDAYSLNYLNIPQLTTFIVNSCGEHAYSLYNFKFYNMLSAFRVTNLFKNASSIKYIELITNWNWSLNVANTDLTHECIIDMFNKLKDLTGENSLTLTIGATNLAKVTDEEKLIATNKNWILA